MDPIYTLSPRLVGSQSPQSGAQSVNPGEVPRSLDTDAGLCEGRLLRNSAFVEPQSEALQSRPAILSLRNAGPRVHRLLTQCFFGGSIKSGFRVVAVKEKAEDTLIQYFSSTTYCTCVVAYFLHAELQDFC